MSLTPEEYVKKANDERKLIKKGADNRTAYKVLQKLAPAFGYAASEIRRVKRFIGQGDLLEAAKSDADVGNLLPHNLVIGGHSGLKFADILSDKFKTKPWWGKFLAHVEDFEEVIWVLPIAGAGYWVIHNTTISADKQRHCVLIPAHQMGLNHVRVSRIELFVEEKRLDD